MFNDCSSEIHGGYHWVCVGYKVIFVSNQTQRVLRLMLCCGWVGFVTIKSLHYINDDHLKPNLPNTNRMHASIQISIAVNPSAFGEFVLILLKMLMRTRKRVMRRAILPDKSRPLLSGIRYISLLHTWDNVRGNEEWDPGDNHEEARGEVVGDDVGQDMPLQCLEVRHIILFLAELGTTTHKRHVVFQ